MSLLPILVQVIPPLVKKLKGSAKSKSNQFNLVVAPAIITILKTYGVEVPVELVIGGYALGNYLLRWITKKPLEAK